MSGKALGGLPGLIQTFKNKGLGDQVASWQGTGENLPVSGAQIGEVLGAELIQQLGTKFGMASKDVQAQLAQMLPNIINQLSTGDMLPSGGLLEQGLGLLKGKLLS